MSTPTQRGPLADLREIPWGTPDAEALARLLAPLSSDADLDRAAATGKLRELISSAAACADPSTEKALLALADRPQAVRHVFRAPLDWTDPAVWDLHRALVDAFGDDQSTTDLARLAGVSLDGMDLDREPGDLWSDLMNRAAREGRLEALLDTALADAAMADHHDLVEQVRERPWRVDATPASGLPAVPRRRVASPALRSEPGRLAALRSAAAGVLGVVVAVALVAGAGWGLTRAVSAARTSSIRGTLASPTDAARVVLTRDGAVVETVPAAPRLAFAPQRLDRDGDGQVDPGWRVHLERTDQPCPPLALPLDRAVPDSQAWSVAVADARPERGGCRIRIEGMEELEVGAVVALDPDRVEPRRYAVVERVGHGPIEARAVGTWTGCHACWPAPASCREAVRALLPGDPGAADRAGDGTCAPEVVRRLRAVR